MTAAGFYWVFASVSPIEVMVYGAALYAIVYATELLVKLWRWFHA